MSVANEPTLGNTTELGSARGTGFLESVEEFADHYSYTALRFYLQAIARHHLQNERIQVCYRYPLPERKSVDIIYSDERARARVYGTMKCACGWVCPVCALYISERRRSELSEALARSRDRYVAVMITYTASHTKSDRLSDLLEKMQKAFRRVKTGRTWQQIKDEYYLVGSVRSVEITYGLSGWHPHYHELMLVDIDGIKDWYDGSVTEYADGLEDALSERWLDMLRVEGLTASEERGLLISTTDSDVQSYIAKWGKMPLEADFKRQASEISHGTTKSARNGNLSVWDILYQSINSPNMKSLFIEYHAATKGRSQLQWSRGLKDLLGVDVIREEQAAEGIETETDRLLADIPIEVWRFAAEHRYIEQLMTVSHTGDASRVKFLVEQLRQIYEKHVRQLPQFDIGI